MTTFDIGPDFHPDWLCNIGELTELPEADAILASPPCERFSVMSLARHWNRDNTPKTTEGEEALELVRHTIKLIQDRNPRFWVLENPRAKLRRLIGPPQATVSWCQYGGKVMKPTDLWGELPPEFKPRLCNRGSPCHTSASRGEHRGTQADDLTRGERAKIPYGLSLELCHAMESSFSG